MDFKRQKEYLQKLLEEGMRLTEVADLETFMLKQRIRESRKIIETLRYRIEELEKNILTKVAEG